MTTRLVRMLNKRPTSNNFKVIGLSKLGLRIEISNNKNAIKSDHTLTGESSISGQSPIVIKTTVKNRPNNLLEPNFTSDLLIKFAWADNYTFSFL